MLSSWAVPCYWYGSLLSSPHLPIHRRSPKRSKDSKGHHVHNRHPAIPTEKHKEERDKRPIERERATKRDGQGRREYNHPGAKSQGCVVSHCGVISIVAFGLGVMHRVRFILFSSSDSIVAAIVIVVENDNTGAKLGESRIEGLPAFQRGSGRFRMKRLAKRSSGSILMANRSMDLRRHRANRTFISPSRYGFPVPVVSRVSR